MQEYQLLSWDSDVFGFPIAKIIPERMAQDQLLHHLADLKQQQVKLVYWASDSLDPISQSAALAAGGIIADYKTTYQIDLENLNNRPVIDAEIESYSQAAPNDDLFELAYESGLYSRFKVDPRISDEQFKKVYRLWMINSVRKQIAQEVLVIKRDNKIVGMVTLGEKNQSGDIGLLAVNPNYRGQQIGSKLVYAAQAWCVNKGYKQGQVVTQQLNLPAAALYEKCGYSVEKVENFFHFWL